MSCSAARLDLGWRALLQASALDGHTGSGGQAEDELLVDVGEELPEVLSVR